jgi:hypothetical protein
VKTRGARLTEKGSGWGGLSGAALFVGDWLVGVIVVDPRGYVGGLVAHCLAAADDGFLAALGAGDPQPVRIADDGLLQLHRHRIAARFANLDLAAVPRPPGTDPRQNVPADELYIQLEAMPERVPRDKDRPGPRDPIARVRDFGERDWSQVHERLRTVEQRFELATPQQVMRTAFEERRSLMVLGVPGSGKTTMLHVLARSCALDDAGLVPLYGRLADLARLSLDSVVELVLRDAVAGLADSDATVTRAALSKAHSAGRICLLLDGLDEVPEALKREVSRWIEQAAAEHPVLVTSRPLQFAPLTNFDVYRVLPLLPRDSSEFVRRWFAVRAGEVGVAPQRQQRWVADRSSWLNDQLTHRPQLREVAANPLMLTFLTVLAADDSRVHLPKFRRDIYAAFENTLFHTWEAQRRGGGLPVSVSPRWAIRALHEIALVLHEAYYPVDGAPSIRPVRGDVATAVAGGLAGAEDSRAVGRRPSPRTQDEVDAAILFWQQAGLLRPTGVTGGAKQFLFAHQTFQEYGAACALAAAFAEDPTGLRAYLQPRLSAQGWGEVLPLTLAGLDEYDVDVTEVLSKWRTEIDDREDQDARYGHSHWRDTIQDPLRLLLAYSIGEGAIVDGAWLRDTLQWLAGQGTHDDAFQALVMVGWSHPAEVLPVLRQLMATADPRIRVRAAEAAGRLGPRDDARLALRRVAADINVDPGWRIVAAWSIARLGATKEAVALLHGLMQQLERWPSAAPIRTDTLRFDRFLFSDPRMQSLVPALSEIGTPDGVQLLAEIGSQRLPLGAQTAVSAVISLHRLGHGGQACTLLAALDRMPLPAYDRKRIGDARRELRCLEAT